MQGVDLLKEGIGNSTTPDPFAELRSDAEALLSAVEGRHNLVVHPGADRAMEEISEWLAWFERCFLYFFTAVHLMILWGAWVEGSRCSAAVLYTIPLYNLILRTHTASLDDKLGWIAFLFTCLVDQVGLATYDLTARDWSLACSAEGNQHLGTCCWYTYTRVVEPLLIYAAVLVLRRVRYEPKAKVLLSAVAAGLAQLWKLAFFLGIRRPHSKIKSEDWFEAARKGNKDFLKSAIKHHDFNVNLRTSDGDTALTLSCQRGLFGNVQVLVDNAKKDLDLNVENHTGESALSMSSTRGHTSILTKLLRCSQLELENGRGEAAILKAVEGDHFDLGLMMQEKMEERKIRPNNLHLRYLRQCVLLGRKINSGKTRIDAKNKFKKQLETYKDLILQGKGGAEQKTASPGDKSTKCALEELEDLCECPVCFEHMSGKGVVDCSNGHCLCRECAGVVRECPMCREDFAERPPARRRAVEEFAAAAQRLGQELRREERSGKMD